MKTTTSFVSVLALTGVASATVPGCLLAGVNKQPVPSDYKSICGAKANEVKSDISAACGSEELTKAALSSFEESCKEQGHPIDGSNPETTTAVSSNETPEATKATITEAAASTAANTESSAAPAATTSAAAPAKPESTHEADPDCTTATPAFPSHWAASYVPEGNASSATPAKPESTHEAGPDCTTASPAFPPHWAATGGSATPVATHVPQAPGVAKPTGFATVSKPAAPIVTGGAAPGAALGTGAGQSGNGNGAAGTGAAGSAPSASNFPTGPNHSVPDYTGAASSNKLSAALAFVAGAVAFFL
ncbi:hypothetical protein KEM56_003915 [Ascosphaera pollenicola]|nr:hypothetical protein KEM56_003915 [Ascosphaera pollenicola]